MKERGNFRDYIYIYQFFLYLIINLDSKMIEFWIFYETQKH